MTVGESNTEINAITPFWVGQYSTPIVGQFSMPIYTLPHLVQKLQLARRELALEAEIVELNVESYRQRSALSKKRGRGRPPSKATPKTIASSDK